MMDVAITKNAARRIALLPNKSLRLEIRAGGCSGFSYEFTAGAEAEDDDRVIILDGSSLIIDPVSMSMLHGAIVDFQQDLMSSGFKVINPNAANGCGCGVSFSI